MTRRPRPYRRAPRTVPHKQRIPWDAASLHRLGGEQLRDRAKLIEQRYPQYARWLIDASVAAPGRRYQLLGDVSAAMQGRDADQ